MVLPDEEASFHFLPLFMTRLTRSLPTKAERMAILRAQRDVVGAGGRREAVGGLTTAAGFPFGSGFGILTADLSEDEVRSSPS
jgi:hypothetical protein